MIFETILGTVSTIIDKIFPDKTQAAQANLELAKMAAQGELEHLKASIQLDLAQAEITKTEAQSDNLFKSGARPFMLWAFGTCIVLQAVIFPYASWILNILGVNTPPLPNIDTGEMLTIVLGLLGLGGMRSFDKSRMLKK